MRIIAFIITVLMLYSAPAFGAVEEKWSDEVIGEALLEELTPDQAKHLCENRAKAKAIEKISGVEIISDTFVRDFTTLSDFINAASYAWVKEVKDVRWDPIEDYRQTSGSPPILLYRVHLKALVVMDKDVDRGFSVKLGLNRQAYEHGDEMVITVQPTRDSYVSVFNVLLDDKVTMIFPNKARNDRFMKKGEKAKFPDRDAGETRKLKMFNTSGKSVAKEYILIIATKEDIDLSLGDFVEAAVNENTTKTGSFKDLLEKLKRIPPRNRAVAIQVYEIRNKL